MSLLQVQEREDQAGGTIRGGGGGRWEGGKEAGGATCKRELAKSSKVTENPNKTSGYIIRHIRPRGRGTGSSAAACMWFTATQSRHHDLGPIMSNCNVQTTEGQDGKGCRKVIRS